jgi:hypothetical protein
MASSPPSEAFWKKPVILTQVPNRMRPAATAFSLEVAVGVATRAEALPGNGSFAMGVLGFSGVIRVSDRPAALLRATEHYWNEAGESPAATD